MDIVNQQIAAVYGGVLDQPLDKFLDFALTRLRVVVPFDSAVWSCGKDESLLQTTLHLVNQRHDDLITLAVRRRGEDVFRNFAMASQGRAVCIEDIMTMAEYRRMPLYQDVLHRIGMEQVMGLQIADPVTSHANYIVVYRADPARPFTAGERTAKAILVPHILQAWRQCQHNALLPARPECNVAGAFLHGRAVADWSGTIFQADPGFGAALATTFPGWSRISLPHEVTTFLRSDRESLMLGALRFTVARGQQYIVVSVMGTVRGGLLGSAELDVARRVASGDCNAQIAIARNVSIATIRNQIASIYQKLGIHSKIELIDRLTPLELP